MGTASEDTYQCPVCRQKNQRGVVALFTVKLHSGIVAAPGATDWKPESIPSEGVVLLVYESGRMVGEKLSESTFVRKVRRMSTE
jgi:hypothetical protein